MRGRTNVSGTGFINGDIVEYEVAENSDIMAGDFVQKLKGYNGDERNVLSVGSFVQNATVYQISEDIILIIHSTDGDMFAHYTTYSFSLDTFVDLKISSYIDRYLICSSRVGDNNQFVVSANGYNNSRTNTYFELISVDSSGEITILSSVDFSSLKGDDTVFFGVETLFQYSKDDNENSLFMGVGASYSSGAGTVLLFNHFLFTFSVSSQEITKGVKVKNLFESWSDLYHGRTSNFRARSEFLLNNKALLIFDKGIDKESASIYMIAKKLELIETTSSLGTEVNETELYSYYPRENSAKGSYYYGYFCMGKISEKYVAIIVTENEKDVDDELVGTFDGTKYYLKICDIELNQIVFSYHFAKNDFLTGMPYAETFFIHAIGDDKFIFGCSTFEKSGMIKAFEFTETKQFKQGKYAMMDKFVPQTINTACSYDGTPYVVGFDTETQYITANSFEIDEDLSINVGNKSVRVMNYYNVIDGVAKQSGQAGDTIEVYVPRTQGVS